MAEKKQKTNIIPSTKVYRTETLNGYAVPAIIENGSYFFVDLSVYENGRVSCWHMEDFEHFTQDVERGWVQPTIPDGECISVYGTGDWVIDKGEWLFDEKSFVEYIKSVIRLMNPHWENIHTYREKVVGGVRVGESGEGTIYKEKSKKSSFNDPEKINGESINLFYKMDEIYYLVKVNIFADGMLELSRLQTPISLTFDEFAQLVAQKQILSDVPKNARVVIYGLGSFNVTETDWCEDISDKVAEIQEILRKFRGEPTLFELCRQAYDNYLKTPNAPNRERLKLAYEQVPAHERPYLGDMDTKDIPIRMVIYGKDQIEDWSHYQVAKAQGEPLPNIILPNEPKNE